MDGVSIDTMRARLRAPSTSDPAMLTASVDDATPWQTVNLAAQAQQRMGNDGTAVIVDLLGDDAPLVDTTQYISGSTLETSSTGTSTSPKWAFKGNYAPSSSNLGSLATYLNTSGQNLVAATPQLGMGASNGGAVDPLTAVTPVTSDTLVGSAAGTTTFTFPAGSGTRRRQLVPTTPSWAASGRASRMRCTMRCTGCRTSKRRRTTT